MNNVYLITFTKKNRFNKSKGTNYHNKHPVDCRVQILHIFFVPIGKKPAPSQQDSDMLNETFR